MPNQTRPMTQLVNKNVESKRMPQEYFVGKGTAQNEDDVRLQERIWSFLKGLPELDLTEVEVDIADGAVTLMGTFTDEQLQGRVVHTIMNFDGVRQVDDRSHLLFKHPQKESFDET